MAVKPDSDRIAKYQTKLSGDLASPRVLLLKAEMVRKATVQFHNLNLMEDAVKTILDEEGLSTTQYPFYLAFGRQCYKLKRKFNGSTLLNRVSIALQRWVADGYNQAILERVRDTVFTLTGVGP